MACNNGKESKLEEDLSQLVLASPKFGVGLGKSKVSWSGNQNASPATVTTSQPLGKPFDWNAARAKIEGEDVVLCSPTSDTQLNETERDTLEVLVGAVKDGEEKIIQDMIEKMFVEDKDPREEVLMLATNSPDFREGRAKGVTATLVKALQRQISGKNMPQLSFELMDYAFFKFFHQPNASTLIAAFSCFDLVKHRLRYSRALVDLASKGDFKGACHGAVALGLWDLFPIEIFCLPLLLQDELSVMESYLASSPVCCQKMIGYLDSFHQQSEQKIAVLCSLYPKIRPIGASKLSKKPLDKLIKRYATAWSLPPSFYPLSVARRAAVDLNYWVKQRYTSDEHNLTLVNWRELLETKVGKDKQLQIQLVEELIRHDTSEAVHWDTYFKLNMLLPNAASSPKTPVFDESSADDKRYYKLRFPDDRVIFVDNLKAFSRFLEDVGKQSQVGVDAEFMSASSEQKISLLQVKPV